MRSIDLSEQKEIEINILKAVDDFCEKNGLRYYLCGGTLLGAIRHKGFIPWDDDIDIIMPRPDYERFHELFNNDNNQYRIHSVLTSPNWTSTFALIEDTRTVKIYSDFNKESTTGISLDVFPMDGSPENKFVRRLYWEFMNIIERIAILSHQKFCVSKHFSDKDVNYVGIKTVLRTGLKFLLIPLARLTIPLKLDLLINKIGSSFDVDSSTFIGVVTFPHYGFKECVKGKPFLKIKKRVFEGMMFNTPDGYEEYLSNLYGDYMKMPSEEKRVSHHNVKGYWKE